MPILLNGSRILTTALRGTRDLTVNLAGELISAIQLFWNVGSEDKAYSLGSEDHSFIVSNEA